jgi:PAS domain S-box-containing protein
MGYAHEELLARTHQQITHPKDLDADTVQARRVLTNEVQTYSLEKRFIRKEGSAVWTESTVSLVRDPTGQPKYFISVVEDISRRKQAEEALKESLSEKETLLKEIHHRVKNNMQLISSMLQLQAGYIKDAEALAVFRESQNRIRSMALIHEKLYQASSLSRIDFAEYVNSLVSILIRSYAPKGQTVNVAVKIESVFLNLDMAIPFGLILNEVISNSLKHAFPDNRRGLIQVELHPTADNAFELTVRDDGVGFSPGFAWETCSSLGVRLIRILTEQIEGHLDVHSNTGVEYRLRFQEPTHQRKEATFFFT